MKKEKVVITDEVFRELLADTDVEAKSMVLSQCIEYKDLDRIGPLLMNGADFNYDFGNNRSPMFKAIEVDDPAVTAKLKQYCKEEEFRQFMMMLLVYQKMKQGATDYSGEEEQEQLDAGASAQMQRGFVATSGQPAASKPVTPNTLAAPQSPKPPAAVPKSTQAKTNSAAPSPPPKRSVDVDEVKSSSAGQAPRKGGCVIC